jgi:hypothetical protein
MSREQAYGIGAGVTRRADNAYIDFPRAHFITNLPNRP